MEFVYPFQLFAVSYTHIEMGMPKEQKPYVAEAKIIRAFSHFILVSLYAKFYEWNGANDSPGIPYVTEPETEAIAQYDRETVAQTYEKIEQDIVCLLYTSNLYPV